MPSSVTLPKRADGKEGNVRQYAQPRGNLPEADNDRGRKGPDPIDEEWFSGQTYDALKVRFSATLGEEPVVEVGVV
jgi:hypothetical protein